MQATRHFTKLRPTLSRNLFKHTSSTNKALTNLHKSRTMSLLPRYATATPYDGGFRSLFRMMDDLATNYESGASPGASTTAIRAFSPRFDVVENKDSYQLHGELPGLDQKDVSIEFTDPHTLVIKGRTETHYESDSTGGDQGNKKITDVSHKASVEDEAAEQAKETTVTTTDSNKNVSNSTGEHGHHQQHQHHQKTKFWVSERSVGEFHRSFSFPSRVDQDAVKASLKQGILTITVPKLAATKGSRKINIESSD